MVYEPIRLDLVLVHRLSCCTLIRMPVGLLVHPKPHPSTALPCPAQPYPRSRLTASRSRLAGLSHFCLFYVSFALIAIAHGKISKSVKYLHLFTYALPCACLPPCSLLPAYLSTCLHLLTLPISLSFVRSHAQALLN